ncbi:membrane-bound lytic murein transglycosylase A [Poseidonocella pacifica]|uniref:peptidoglycan lytic exotransglycosylase n=1 Tax=Poseidonocella pacifica TaxID=871651 RepID=A0A1I0XU16_9RHOB|nr:MltA domain-containing protein [Poseidonocella pacifica]SFB04639.1 membrane-bound lytic murein transglycosylase A [Poseidonocella pacifica]
MTVGIDLIAGQDHPAQREIAFDDLIGWAEDNHHDALKVYRQSGNEDLVGPDDARAFFEERFRPVLIGDPECALFTGYFEPELDGSLTPSTAFPVPIYRRPDALSSDAPWLTRCEIEESDALSGLELAWVASAADAFFLQVQGSGRIRLREGGCLRVGYDGRNGHPYRSIGKELLRRSIFTSEEISADAIRDWIEVNPVEGRALMHHNPSFVFFRPLNMPEAQGPIGTLGCPVTAMRSIAVDPDHTPLGLPVWIETDGPQPIRRLMIAQDTGAAIKGPQRADIFIGTGRDAGRIAGGMKQGGRMIALLPRLPAA